jgi:hypothetical protein
MRAPAKRLRADRRRTRSRLFFIHRTVVVAKSAMTSPDRSP